MTRLLYLPDDVTVIQLEVETPPERLCASINAGLRPVECLRNAPPGRLTASQLGGTVVVAPSQKRSAALKKDRPPCGLSRRQAQVHELAVRGLTSGEIAIMLRLSRRTVNYHLNQVKNRLRDEQVPGSGNLPLPLNFSNGE